MRKQTLDTATLFGLSDRGVIKVGKKADCNVIDMDALNLDAPRMAYVLPAGGRQSTPESGREDCSAACGVGAFVERLFASALGAMYVYTVYLGDRLGFYRVLAEAGPLTALGSALPRLVDVYRSGAGNIVDGTDAMEAQGDFNRPWLVGSFATEYLPQIPDAHETLTAAARVVDIACGAGWAAIACPPE